MNIRWVIQDNLIAERDRSNISKHLDEMNIEHEEVIVIPFSKELPKFTIDDKENIYYGSTTFMNNLYREMKPKGLFFNDNFSMSNYLDKWGEHMLNTESEIIKISEAVAKYKDDEDQWFFRPDGDGKEFDGQVQTGTKMCQILENTVKNDERLCYCSKIMVSKPYNIRKEWRNYIVNGKVITSTRYRQNFRLSKSGEDIPEDMIKFVEDRCKEYQPHDIFAMDIALTGGEYYIIECGCMNSVGFYECDIKSYLQEISKYMNESSS